MPTTQQSAVNLQTLKEFINSHLPSETAIDVSLDKLESYGYIVFRFSNPRHGFRTIKFIPDSKYWYVKVTPVYSNHYRGEEVETIDLYDVWEWLKWRIPSIFPQVQVEQTKYTGDTMLIYELTSKIDTSSLSTQPDWYYTLNIEDAKKIVKHLKNSSKGSFEYIFWVKPIRSAVRKKQTEITIKTGGFTTSKFFQVLCDVAGGFENTQEVDRLDEDFTNWLTANYDYSGQGIEDENYWLSKSPTDFNLYSETQLKQEYHGLGKFVENPTKAW